MTGRATPPSPASQPDHTNQAHDSSQADAATSAHPATSVDRTVPPDLTAAMRAALQDNPSPTASELLAAAEELLRSVLHRGCESRAGALDLLTVDALITTALETAAADPELLESFPELAMRRIAAQAREQ